MAGSIQYEAFCQRFRVVPSVKTLIESWEELCAKHKERWGVGGWRSKHMMSRFVDKQIDAYVMPRGGKHQVTAWLVFEQRGIWKHMLPCFSSRLPAVVGEHAQIGVLPACCIVSATFF